MVRDGIVYCDKCERKLEKEALDLIAKHNLKVVYCLPHLKDWVSRGIKAKREEIKNEPRPPKHAKNVARVHPAPKPAPQTSRYTTERKVADLFAVRVSFVRRYLVSTKLLTAETVPVDGARLTQVKIPKTEVQRLVLLIAVNSSKLDVIEAGARKYLIDNASATFRRLYDGALD